METGTVEIEKSSGGEELEAVFMQNVELDSLPKEFQSESWRFDELMMRYSCAIREVRTKLEVLNDEFKVKKSHNPIEIIKFRVKKPASIREKLIRRGFPVTIRSIEENLHDVAGVRVVCSYVQDIYAVAEMLTMQNDLEILEVKDYIKKPKENGYRSLHLVISVPVFFSDYCKRMKVEVQIRTMAMDFWATLEHQLKYKQADVSEEIAQELARCSAVIAETDLRMQGLYNTINAK